MCRGGVANRHELVGDCVVGLSLKVAHYIICIISLYSLSIKFTYSYIPLHGPDRTGPDQTKSADFVRSGPVGPGRAHLVEFSYY